MPEVGSRNLSEQFKGPLEVTLQDTSGKEIGYTTIYPGKTGGGSLGSYIGTAELELRRRVAISHDDVKSPWLIVAWNPTSRPQSIVVKKRKQKRRLSCPK